MYISRCDGGTATSQRTGRVPVQCPGTPGSALPGRARKAAGYMILMPRETSATPEPRRAALLLSMLSKPGERCWQPHRQEQVQPMTTLHCGMEGCGEWQGKVLGHPALCPRLSHSTHTSPIPITPCQTRAVLPGPGTHLPSLPHFITTHPFASN